MSNLRATNEKLRRRACAIISEEAGIDRGEAYRIFEASRGDLRVALVMARTDVSRDEAQRILESHGGSVRRALDASP
jgi:N-acetylmuramic acid 6-phosphate etherase